MTIPLPPLKSPQVPRDDESEHQTITGTYRAVRRTEFATKLQWGAIGAVCLSIATGFGWALNKMDVVNTASAQVQATANAALDAGKTNAARIEAIDAGTRLAIERLERKIDAIAESTDRKLDRLLNAVQKR